MSGAADRDLPAGSERALQLAAEWGLLRQLDGAVVCCTGRMSMKRTDLATLIEAAGGVFSDRVGAGTDILIVADDADTETAKLAAARARGTTVVTETSFAEVLLPGVAELEAGGPGVTARALLLGLS